MTHLHIGEHEREEESALTRAIVDLVRFKDHDALFVLVHPGYTIDTSAWIPDVTGILRFDGERAVCI